MSMPNLWMTQVINVSCEMNKQRTKKTSTIASQASLLFRTYLMGGVLYLTKHASFWPSQNVIKPDSIILLSPFSYLQKRKENQIKGWLFGGFIFRKAIFVQIVIPYLLNCVYVYGFRAKPESNNMKRFIDLCPNFFSKSL